VLAGEDTGQQ